MDVLDGLELDCDQDKVIKSLIETVQPDEKPVPIDYFHRKAIPVEVWKKNEKTKVSIPLRIWVQRQKDVDVKNWTGPLLEDKERKENSMGLVGIWNLGSDDYHAIYVTKCRRLERGIDKSFRSIFIIFIMQELGLLLIFSIVGGSSQRSKMRKFS